MNGLQIRQWYVGVTVLALALLLAPGTALAQQETGNLFATAYDEEGEVLPGVTVEVTGIGAPKTQITDAEGRVRVLNLSPGTYQVTASLEGFSTVEHPNVSIRVGRNTTIELRLSAAIEETITVTAESPLLDERRINRGNTVSQVELEKIPTARDPWAVLNQTPGVLTDRINVGGDQSGQQSVFIGQGVSDDENNFNIDGVIITDMAAIGASPTYYDFDQFEEMQVSTGGSDIEQVAAGASINLVTKRGTNQPRGSARFLRTDKDELLALFEEGSRDFADELENGDGSGGLTAQDLEGTPGNSVNEIIDFGFEAGGAVMRDRLWLWGAFGRTDIKQLNPVGLADDTLLENSAIKVNAQLGTPNSWVSSWNRGDKLKFGRLGAPPATRSLESGWDQDGPSEIWKAEDSHVFTSRFFLTGQFSFVDGGFQLQSKGGSFPGPTTTDADEALANGETILDESGIWQNGWYSGGTDRDTTGYQVDGSYFFDTGAVNHELKFGVNYREFERESAFGWPGGRQNANLTCESIGTCGFFTDVLGLVGDDFGIAIRTGRTPSTQEYLGVWLADTLSFSRLTLNAGLRWDQQEGVNDADAVEANPLFPNELVALDFPGNDGGFDDWSTPSPRVGITYALGQDRSTLLRANFSRFAEQLSTTDINNVNPVGYTAINYVWDDVDGDNVFDAGEPNQVISPIPSPTLTTISEIDPGLDPEITDELSFGIEHAFLPEFVVGLDFTLRETSDNQEARTFIFDETGAKRVALAEDYELKTTVCSDGSSVPHQPDGQSWCADYYGLRDGRALAGGTFLTNGDRVIEYQGVSLTATKRLTNRWMLRGFITFADQEWQDTADFQRFDNPTDGVPAGDNDGELFVITSAGSGPFSNTFIQSSWSANINGMYQVAPDRPWGFNIAANLFAREGYALPYRFATEVSAAEEPLAAVTSDVDTIRADDPVVFDLRLEKEMRFIGDLSGVVSIEAFNLFNDDAVTQREIDLDTPTANFLAGTVPPRVYRLGFRLNWR